jgi:hypothetical protein
LLLMRGTLTHSCIDNRAAALETLRALFCSDVHFAGAHPVRFDWSSLLPDTLIGMSGSSAAHSRQIG